MKITRFGPHSAVAEAFIQHFKKEVNPNLTDALGEILVANFSDHLGKREQLAIEMALKKENCLFLFDNIKQEQFPENSLFTTDSDLCILKSNRYGRQQHLLILGSKQQPYFPDLAHFKIRNSRTIKNNDPQILFKTEAVPNMEKKVLLDNMDWEGVTEWMQTSSSILKPDPPSSASISGSITLHTFDYNNTAVDQADIYSSFCTYTVELTAITAPYKKKIIKFAHIKYYTNLPDTIIPLITNLNKLVVYPGTKATFVDSDIHLPLGWHNLKATNRLQNGTDKPLPNIDYSASKLDYNILKNDIKTPPIKTNWNSFYTEVHYCWESVFSKTNTGNAVYPEQSSLSHPLGNELLYEAPYEDNSNQMFRTFIGQPLLKDDSKNELEYLNSNSIQQSATQYWDYFSLNLAAVL